MLINTGNYCIKQWTIRDEACILWFNVPRYVICKSLYELHIHSRNVRMLCALSLFGLHLPCWHGYLHTLVTSLLEEIYLVHTVWTKAIHFSLLYYCMYFQKLYFPLNVCEYFYYCTFIKYCATCMKSCFLNQWKWSIDSLLSWHSKESQPGFKSWAQQGKWASLLMCI